MRTSFVMLALAASVFALSAAAWSGAPATDLVRIAWWTDVGLPTPFAASTVGPGGVVRLSLIYDTLTWKDAVGTVPWLAESWRVSSDATTYTFVLRPGLVWHDGRPLTAADVKFSFDYYRLHPFVWVDTGVVDAIRVDGARTVTITLRHPFAPFLTDVAGVVPIIPSHLWRDVREPRRAQDLSMATGSGPYRLAEYRPGTGAYRLSANDGYFRGRPRVREIQYSLVPPERQMLAVQTGQVDVAMSEIDEAARAFAGHAFLRAWRTPPLSIARLLFNLHRPPFDQKAVRQAMAHAINRAQLVTLATGGSGLPGNPGIVPPADAWYAPGVRGYPHDPAKATSLLQSAGAAATAVELLASPSPIVPVLHEMLRAAGFEVSVRTVDARTRAALIAEGRFQVALTFHVGAGGDPDYLRRWLEGGEANQFGQTTAFVHPEFARLADQQARAIDARERHRLIARMQAILAEELPTLPLFYRRFVWIYDSRSFSPVDTPGGLMNGIPLIENKVAFLER